jgi:hypothetical protein
MASKQHIFEVFVTNTVRHGRQARAEAGSSIDSFENLNYGGFHRPDKIVVRTPRRVVSIWDLGPT